MKFDHLANDVAYTPPRCPPKRVLRWVIRDSHVLSSSIVNATSARDSNALIGRGSLTVHRLAQLLWRHPLRPGLQPPNAHALAAAL